MDNLFVSATGARLGLASEADVLAAIDSRVLDENHYLDLKREAKSGEKPNRETARDLASFAIDGGSLIIGIGETDDGGIEATPQSLSGLPERLEQIAATGVDPPLTVLTQAIPTDRDPTRGYLIVHVPASAEAPHMVDGKYLARGDKTKRYLTDPEVVRLHQRRLTAITDGVRLLDIEFGRDPFNGDNRQNAHLFVLAGPLSGRPDLLADVTDTSDPRPSFDLLQAGLTSDITALLGKVGAAQFSQCLQELQTRDVRPDGVAWTSHGLAPGRTPRNDGVMERAGELEIRDDGSLRLYHSQLSRPTAGGDSVLVEAVAVGSVRRFPAVVRAAAERAGYYGNWSLAVGATRLAGCSSLTTTTDGWQDEGPTLGEDIYRRAVTASYADLLKNPGLLTERLIGPLLRPLRSRERYRSVFDDNEPSS